MQKSLKSIIFGAADGDKLATTIGDNNNITKNMTKSLLKNVHNNKRNKKQNKNKSQN